MPRSRRNRSKLNAVDDDRRQAIYDVAKSRMKARGEKDGEMGSIKGSADTTRQVHQPVKDTTPANVGVNRNAGSAREGQKFRIKDAAGGKSHIYADGTRVFVKDHKPDTQATNPSKSRFEDAARNLARERQKVSKDEGMQRQIGQAQRKRRNRRQAA